MKKSETFSKISKQLEDIEQNPSKHFVAIFKKLRPDNKSGIFPPRNT